MAKHGKLTPAQLAALTKRPLKLDFERQIEPPGPAPHIAQQLRKWLIDWADQRDYDIYSDGLVVRTTIDSRLQKAANQAVARQMAQLQTLADGGASAVEERPCCRRASWRWTRATAMVRAWVGSRDFAQEQFDHVSQARRQPGSAFKPFVYGAAFMMGLSPTLTLIDEPVAIRLPGGEVWTPSDATPPSYQPMTLRDGLVFSKNTITAQVMQKVGPERVARLAQAMGVRQSKLDPVPSLALGTSPVTLREMVAAYGTIANGGHYVRADARHPRRRPRRPGAGSIPARAGTGGGTAAAAGAGARERDARRGRRRHRRGHPPALRHHCRRGRQDRHHAGEHRWLVHHDASAAGGRRAGGLQRQQATMGSWGQGARSALPMVGEVFQQALRNRWIDPAPSSPFRARGPFRAEERERPMQGPEDIVKGILNELRRIFR